MHLTSALLGQLQSHWLENMRMCLEGEAKRGEAFCCVKDNVWHDLGSDLSVAEYTCVILKLLEYVCFVHVWLRIKKFNYRKWKDNLRRNTCFGFHYQTKNTSMMQVYKKLRQPSKKLCMKGVRTQCRDGAHRDFTSIYNFGYLKVPALCRTHWDLMSVTQLLPTLTSQSQLIVQ